MRMKSVLVLTALSAATFLSGMACATHTAHSDKAPHLTALSNQLLVSAQGLTDELGMAPKKSKYVKQYKKPKHKHKHKKQVKNQRPQRPLKRVTVHKVPSKHPADPSISRKLTEVPALEGRRGLKTNFLVGASAAYAVQQENIISQFNSPFFADFRYTRNEFRVSDVGPLFGGFGGAQFICNRLLVGIEGGIDFGSFEHARGQVYTDQVNDTLNPLNPAFQPNLFDATVVYDRGDIYSLSGRMGYFITSFFMPYIRLGTQVSRDEVSYQTFVHHLNNNDGVVEEIYPNFASRRKNVWGVVYGLGAEFPLHIGPMSIRFEWNVVRTKSMILYENGRIVTGPNGQVGPLMSGQHKILDPQTNIGRVQVVWNFV